MGNAIVRRYTESYISDFWFWFNNGRSLSDAEKAFVWPVGADAYMSFLWEHGRLAITSVEYNRTYTTDNQAYVAFANPVVHENYVEIGGQNFDAITVTLEAANRDAWLSDIFLPIRTKSPYNFMAELP